MNLVLMELVTATDDAIKAEANMKLLEERDPKTVNDAKRYLIR